MGREKRGPLALEAWARQLTDGYPNVHVSNMTTSWRNGLAFCALIHRFRPDLIEFEKLDPSDIIGNCSLAFETAESKLGIPALLDPEDMASCPVPDRLSVLTYVAQFYSLFKNAEKKSTVPLMMGLRRDKDDDLKTLPSDKSTTPSEKIAQSKTLSNSSLNTTDATNNSLTSHLDKPSPSVSATKRRFEQLSSSVGTKRLQLLAPPPCSKCQNPVYISERTVFNKKLYHRKCFRCHGCDNMLNPHTADVSADGNSFFCISKSCQLELFKLNRDKNGGEVIQEKNDKPIFLPSKNSVTGISDPSLLLSINAKSLNEIVKNEESADLNGHDENSESKVSKLAARFECVQKSENEAHLQKTVENSETIIKNSEDNDLKTSENVSDAVPVKTNHESNQTELNHQSTEETEKLSSEISNARSNWLQNQIKPEEEPEKNPTVISNDKTEPTSLDEDVQMECSGKDEEVPDNEMKKDNISEEEMEHSGKEKDEFNEAISEDKPEIVEITKDKSNVSSTTPEKSDSPLGAHESASESDEKPEESDILKEAISAVPINELEKTEEMEKGTEEDNKDESPSELEAISVNSEAVAKENEIETEAVTTSPEETKSVEDKPNSEEKATVPSNLQIVAEEEAKIKTPSPSPRKKKKAPQPILREKPPIPSPRLSTPTPASRVSIKEYPEELNPFGDEEEPKPTPSPKPRPKSSIPAVAVTPANPFEEDDEEEEVEKENGKVPPSPLPRTSTPKPYNPFDDEENDIGEYGEDDKPTGIFARGSHDDTSSISSKTSGLSNTSGITGELSSSSHLQKSFHSGDVSSGSTKLRSRKNRRAPLPPGMGPTPEPPTLRSPSPKKVIPVSPEVKAMTKEIKVYRKKRRAPPPKRRVEPLPEEQIKTELHDLEIKQRELERQGISLEGNIRQQMGQDEEAAVESSNEQLDEMIIQLWSIVNEKNDILRRQTELEYLRRSHRLEEMQSELEFQLRILMDTPEAQRAPDHSNAEQLLLDELLKLVDERNEVVDWLDYYRQMDREEEMQVTQSIHQFKHRSISEMMAHLKLKSKKDRKKEDKVKNGKKSKEEDVQGNGKGKKKEGKPALGLFSSLRKKPGKKMKSSGVDGDKDGEETSKMDVN